MYSVKNLDELLVDGTAVVAITHFHDIPQNDGDGDLCVVTHTDEENKIHYTGVVSVPAEFKETLKLASPEKPVDATISKEGNSFTTIVVEESAE